MKSYLIASQKGGAGKTTLVGALGVEAARLGLRVLLIDLDPQQSLRRWWNRREAEAPVMLDQDPAPQDAPAVLARARAAFDLVVIDTPPAAHAWIGRIAAASDITLIPVQPSPHDIGAVGATVAAVGRAPWAFVVSRSQARTRMADAARTELMAHGRVAPININQRIAWAEAAAAGQTAPELGDTAAAAEVEALSDWIAHATGAPWASKPKAKKGATL